MAIALLIYISDSICVTLLVKHVAICDDGISIVLPYVPGVGL